MIATDFARIGLALALVAAAVHARSGAVRAGDEPIDLALAARYFAEARDVCARDGGSHWGVRLDGPMLFVDPRTRGAVANAPDAEGRLAAERGVWAGSVPASMPIANMAITWSGVRWTMILWPLPSDATWRASLMAHELYHRVQHALGLPARNPSNEHLDGLDGRYLLQLEWRALDRALEARGVRRREAVRDALVFRARRRSLLPGTAPEERALELNEGLAEYTGCALAGHSKTARVDLARALLEGGPSRPSFTRSFAYVSGPAYGLLLDDASPNWRRDLGPDDDLGFLLQRAHGIRLPADTARLAEVRAARYDGTKLFERESARAAEREAVAARLRARFVDGPLLVLDLDDPRVSFDPNSLVPLGKAGTVYPTMQASDAWGSLTVTGGALLASDWSTITVAAPSNPDERPLRGDGWTLDLAPGWHLAADVRRGNFVVRRVVRSQ
jgi:hypothetical protein